MSVLYGIYKKLSHNFLMSTAAYFVSDYVQPIWNPNRRYVIKTHIENLSYEDVKKNGSDGVKIAYICDEMTYQNFHNLTPSVYLTPWNWYEVLEKEKPDVLFCESAWSGIYAFDGCWRGRIYKNSKVKYNNRKILFNILEYCEKKHIKTVFWNKEDPTYFGNKQYDFVDTALRFEYIFTTCVECVQRYKQLGHTQVEVLAFGFSPQIYNPMDTFQKKNTAIFAGSWYPDQKRRCKDMEQIFQLVLKNGIDLEIYDRNANTKHTVNHFPDAYKKYVKGYVPFEKMGEKVKHAQYAININTVTDSETMFARRVFEMMASNSCLISNESKGIRRQFSKRVWFINENFDRKHLKEVCRENVQEVLTKHTNIIRMKQVLKVLGMKEDEEKICIGIITREQQKTEKRKNIEVSYYSELARLPDNIQYFIISDKESFSIDKIIQMLVHYQYLKKDVGVFFSEQRYQIGESYEVNDTLFPYQELEKVQQGNMVKKYGI